MKQGPPSAHTPEVSAFVGISVHVRRNMQIASWVYDWVESKGTGRWLETHLLPLMHREEIEVQHLIEILDELSSNNDAPHQLQGFAKTYGPKLKKRFQSRGFTVDT